MLARPSLLEGQEPSPSARAPDDVIVLVGSLDEQGVVAFEGSCRRFRRRASEAELVDLALRRPDTAGHHEGVDAGRPPPPRPDPREVDLTGERGLFDDHGRIRPVEVLDGWASDGGLVRVGWKLNGSIPYSSIVEANRSGSLRTWEHIPSDVLVPVLRERYVVGPVTFLRGTPVDGEGCPRLERPFYEPAYGPTLLAPLGPSACTCNVGRTFTPDSPTQEGRSYSLLGPSFSIEESSTAVLRASGSDTAKPAATLKSCGSIHEIGPGNHRYAHVVAGEKNMEVRGWVAREAITEGGVFCGGVMWGISCPGPQRTQVPAGEVIEDEGGSVLAVTLDATSLQVLGVRDAVAWVLVPGLRSERVGRVQYRPVTLED